MNLQYHFLVIIAILSHFCCESIIFGSNLDGLYIFKSQKMPESNVETVESDVNNQQLSEQPKSIGATAERNQEDYANRQTNLSGTGPINRHVSFVLGLVPTLDNFQDDQVIDFQLGVIELMKKIKNSPTASEEPKAKIGIR
ncbi:uncharacterized protein LOC129906810 isoform X2 [Episyrphus balteatus]|uniref:uncharacterized protein LOC129906810 isoform X2 n=1 Tax=Episyrphus balteatus TaxID=286459 RepID=UPI002486BEAA|nr:uncharacterized protein LOC129906810 isoform X2 [Episyrphus balteatus]